MRTGAAAAHRGYFHETCFYSSDEELLAVVVPFVLDGATAGEPTIVALSERNAALTRAALGDAPNVRFIGGDDQYPRPATTIRSYRSMFGDLLARGASQIRVVGDVPHPGTGVSWGPWARYEALVNHVYGSFPIWGLCPYDTRITPSHVLRDVERTHPHIATTDGRHVRNPRFEPVEECLRTFAMAAPHPIEDTAPTVEARDPELRVARRMALHVGTAAQLAQLDADGLLLSVAELLTNANLHGRQPVTVRMWADIGRVVVTVTDSGDGPRDLGVGLMPVVREPGAGGLGLWIVHQIATDVVLRRDEHGFTVRAVLGEPLP